MGQKIPKLKKLSLALSLSSFLLGMEQKQSSDQNLNNSLLNKQFDNLKHEPSIWKLNRSIFNTY